MAMERKKGASCTTWRPVVPKDHVLLKYYLSPKLHRLPLPLYNEYFIQELDIYSYPPFDLLGGRPESTVMYFFTRPSRKGGHFNRVAGKGYWKGTCYRYVQGTDGAVIGKVSSFVYCEKDGTKKKKTNWQLNEYTLPEQDENLEVKMDCVLCKVYLHQWKKDKSSEGRNTEISDGHEFTNCNKEDTVASTDTFPIEVKQQFYPAEPLDKQASELQKTDANFLTLQDIPFLDFESDYDEVGGEHNDLKVDNFSTSRNFPFLSNIIPQEEINDNINHFPVRKNRCLAYHEITQKEIGDEFGITVDDKNVNSSSVLANHDNHWKDIRGEDFSTGADYNVGDFSAPTGLLPPNDGISWKESGGGQHTIASDDDCFDYSDLADFPYVPFPAFKDIHWQEMQQNYIAADGYNVDNILPDVDE